MDKERIEIYKSDTSGERVDICGARLSGASRSVISSLIDNGFFFVNNKIPKKSDKVKVGDIIEIRFQPEKLPDLTPKEIDFKIILNRENFAIIDKPAFLTVHPAPGHYDDTLVNGLLYAFNIKDEDNGFRPGIVHRLDKDTSGLLIIAKNSEARSKLSSLFSERKITKKYLAICKNEPNFIEKTVNAPIGRDKFNRKKMSINEKGKEAISIFRVKEVFKKSFLAEVEILTGRTHQIRVHASHINHPLIGDELYSGKDNFDFNRQALHSHYLEFIEPFNNELIKVTSNLPDDMEKLIEKIKP